MIQKVATVLSISFICSFIIHKMKKPTLLGHMFAGMFLKNLIGWETFHLFEEIGHFGLLFLIFQIGLEFDIDSFKENWKKSFLIFLTQLILSVFIAFLLDYFWYTNFSFFLFMIFLLVLSSTAVVVRLLDQMNKLYTKEGYLILNILILQDLSIFPITILLSEVGQISIPMLGSKIFFSIFILCLLMKFLTGEWNKLFKPLKYIFDGNQEMMTLAAGTFCFGFSFLSEFFGLSLSYGPFLAGLILGSQGNKHDILVYTQSIAASLLMIFFIFIGSMINITFIQNNISIVISLTILLLFIKILISFIALKFNGLNNEKSLFIALTLSQASEFSFAFVALLSKSGEVCPFYLDLTITLCVISLSLGTIVPLFSSQLTKLFFAKTYYSASSEQKVLNA